MGNCGFGESNTWSLDSFAGLSDCRIGLEFRWCRHEMLNEDDKAVAQPRDFLCYRVLFRKPMVTFPEANWTYRAYFDSSLLFVVMINR